MGCCRATASRSSGSSSSPPTSCLPTSSSTEEVGMACPAAGAATRSVAATAASRTRRGVPGIGFPRRTADGRLGLAGTVVVVVAVAAHGVDGGDGEVLGDLDLDLGPVGLADDVRLVGRAAVDVGLEAIDRAGDLGEGGGANLGRGGPGQRLLGLAVDRVTAVIGRAGRRAAGRSTGDGGAADGGCADSGGGDELGAKRGHGAPCW